jgi:hypothetical protein
MHPLHRRCLPHLYHLHRQHRLHRRRLHYLHRLHRPHCPRLHYLHRLHRPHCPRLHRLHRLRLHRLHQRPYTARTVDVCTACTVPFALPAPSVLPPSALPALPALPPSAMSPSTPSPSTLSPSISSPSTLSPSTPLPSTPTTSSTTLAAMSTCRCAAINPLVPAPDILWSAPPIASQFPQRPADRRHHPRSQITAIPAGYITASLLVLAAHRTAHHTPYEYILSKHTRPTRFCPAPSRPVIRPTSPETASVTSAPVTSMPAHQPTAQARPPRSTPPILLDSVSESTVSTYVSSVLGG